MKGAKNVKDYFYWMYYQFLLITCCIDMEPWEQALLHAGLVTITTMLLFTAYVFIPMHLRLAFRFFLQLLVN